MEQRKTKWGGPAQAPETEQLLVSSYSQLTKWAAVLTRGDVTRAQDIVQELCLYFTLTKPDLSDVSNLDGYLYTCLRHIYLSRLARSSREAQRFVSIADFDSFDFAIAAKQSGDLLERQNDLRRICNYAIWRKQSSKSASYDLVHRLIFVVRFIPHRIGPIFFRLINAILGIILLGFATFCAIVGDEQHVAGDRLG